MKWNDIEENIYDRDQFESIVKKLLAIMGTDEEDFSYSKEQVDDSELFESLQMNRNSQFHPKSQ
jgi:hypothetical protein